MTKPPAWQHDRGTRFYRTAAVLAPLIVLAGFWLTYVVPMAEHRFAGPSVAHFHGLFLASWLILVVVQVWLVPGRTRIHRKLGLIAVPIAMAIAVSTFLVGLAATRRDVALNGAEAAVGLTGNITAPVIFLALVMAAIRLRRDPQWHKRLIFIATVAIMWPAWFRWRHFLPWIVRPDITLGLIAADLPIVIALVRDRWRFGAVHPAYLWIGLPLISEQTAEALLFGSNNPAWIALGRTIYSLVQ